MNLNPKKKILFFVAAAGFVAALSLPAKMLAFGQYSDLQSCCTYKQASCPTQSSCNSQCTYPGQTNYSACIQGCYGQVASCRQGTAQACQQQYPGQGTCPN